jgi:hypothetical protein
MREPAPAGAGVGAKEWSFEPDVGERMASFPDSEACRRTSFHSDRAPEMFLGREK